MQAISQILLKTNIFSGNAFVVMMTSHHCKGNQPMTNEERDRAMDFVIESLAGLTVNGQKQSVRLEKLIESQEKATYRLDRYERIMKMVIRAGRRERRTRRENDDRLARALVELTEAHKRTEDSIAHTDTKLDALVDIVRKGLNGN